MMAQAATAIVGAILVAILAATANAVGLYLRAHSKGEFLREFGVMVAFLAAGILWWVSGSVSGHPEAMYLLAVAGTISGILGVASFLWYLRRQP